MTSLFPVEIDNAETRRRGKTLVGPVSMTLNAVGVTVVIGPNGSGKTTLLRLLHGAARLNQGSIRWAVPNAEAQEAQEFVFQKPVMLRRSVMENLIFPLRLRGQSRKSASTEAERWAARVGLSHMLDRPATVLSGGEQQKLAIARALITQPQLVFLDEPTASLDGPATGDIETILAEARAAGTQLILSTHQMGQARRLADEVVFMLQGKVHETGSAKTFFDEPKTEAARAFLNGDIVT